MEADVMVELQILLDKLVSQKPIQQAILAVESEDGSLCWFGARGVNVTPESPFFIASIDKLFNAVIVLKLAEQGKLKLDDPITAYLPAELVSGIHTLNGRDQVANITIRHLLSHTSGLADWLEDTPKNGQSLVEQVLEQGDCALTFAEIAERVRSLKPHFPPQDLSATRLKARYSDTNFILLIALIETICASPLHRVHVEMLYTPLGLNHTCFPGASMPLSATPDPIPLRAGGQFIQLPKLIASLRGIYSTARDMIVFLRKLTQGEVFENPQTFAQMQSPWNRFGFPLDRAALRSPGWPIEYALGLMRFQLPRLFTGLKRLPAVIGHTGSTGCWLFWCPEMKMYLTGSVDEVSAGAVPYRLTPQLLKILSTRVED